MSGSKSPRDYIADKLVGIPRSGIRDFFDIVSTMKDVISLGIGEPDFTTPWHIREHAIYALERGATSYTSNLGLLKLRKALAAYVEQQFGGVYNPADEILVAVGVSEALDLAIRAITNPGDEIIYHEPCYVSYRPLITLAHGVPVAIQTQGADQFRITEAQLRAVITPKSKAIILNYPNNPTGAALRKEDVEMIARVCAEHDILVIADEIYAELTYDRPHHSFAAVPGMKDRTIFLHGFSKAWAMTGFRMGYSCAPPALTDAMMKIHQYSMLCAPILSQEAALEALTNPAVDIGAMRDSYRERRNFLIESFRELDIPCHVPEGAFYVFPEIRKFGLSSKDFALRLLNEKKVAAVPGTAFGTCGEGYLRCAYATSLDQLKVAVKLIGEFIRGL